MLSYFYIFTDTALVLSMLLYLCKIEINQDFRVMQYFQNLNTNFFIQIQVCLERGICSWRMENSPSELGHHASQFKGKFQSCESGLKSVCDPPENPDPYSALKMKSDPDPTQKKKTRNRISKLNIQSIADAAADHSLTRCAV